ncbi:hypothetical protein CMI40_02650 [Candidatus Pacearchaeota archaeon]|jgi:predicted deacetylase|nr:hypothetical protein [Candidatus Pacearchaeota archaeon]|tara:strand:- start:1126 stop:1629 length:504 start_codon:yes stop_codon:yes gene_type:complete
MSKKRVIVISIIISLILILFFIRLLNTKEIDDVTPEIPCLDNLLKKIDILWIIPKFNNKTISEDKEWCNYILSLNKTLGLHGVNHNYNEFKTNRNEEYIKEGIDIFKECFNFKPEIFKAPQLSISRENKELIKENNLELKGSINQLFHKVYHCNDTGIFSNEIIDIF